MISMKKIGLIGASFGEIVIFIFILFCLTRFWGKDKFYNLKTYFNKLQK